MNAPAFRFTHVVAVRFRDLDAMGHAHHTLPLVYLEEARAAYWREVAGRAELDDIDYVLAEVRVRFHARILWPATLTVALATTRLGGSSFEMAFEIRDSAGQLLSSGTTSHVMFDYDAERSMKLPRELRKRLAAFEGLEENASG
ncbi:MAG: thioesterase family protein [Gemmatimonadota bacterium]